MGVKVSINCFDAHCVVSIISVLSFFSTLTYQDMCNCLKNVLIEFHCLNLIENVINILEAVQAKHR